MVLGHHGNDLPIKRDRLQNYDPLGRVFLHQGKFLVRKPAGFVQNISGDTDLADVMQESAPMDPFEFQRGKPHLPSYLQRNFCYPFGMP